MKRVDREVIAEALGVTEVELAERAGFPRPVVEVRGEPGSVYAITKLTAQPDSSYGLLGDAVWLTKADVARILVACAGPRAMEILKQAMESEAPSPAFGF